MYILYFCLHLVLFLDLLSANQYFVAFVEANDKVTYGSNESYFAC